MFCIAVGRATGQTEWTNPLHCPLAAFDQLFVNLKQWLLGWLGWAPDWLVTWASAGLDVAGVLGVFLGSAAWWLTLSLGVGLMRDRLTASHMVWINRISGTTITIFGIVALISK